MQGVLKNFSYDEKVKIFSYDYLRCCVYISNLEQSSIFFTKKLFSRLIESSQILEDFLDYHGAKNNKNWYYYRELSAAVRHLSIGSYSQKHILNRLVFYDLVNTEDFEREGRATFNFLIKSLIKLAPIVLDEARRLNIPVPDDNFDTFEFPGVTTSDLLDYDIDDENKDLQKKHIVKIASEFLCIARNFDHLGFYEPYDLKKILEIVPDKINEVEIRQFEMLVHNLQSAFDTYVIHGGYRFGNRKLKDLRGCFSIVFHLLQMIGRLLHFYERHLHEAGYKNIYKKVQEQLLLLVDSEVLLDRTINYGFYYVCHFLRTGKDLAGEILNENIERSSITVGIPVKLGFHSRPSLMVAKIVRYYGGQVELCVGEDRYDVDNLAMSDESKLPLKINKASADLEMTAILKNDNISANIIANLQSVKISSNNKDQAGSIANTIASALSDVSKFSARADINGTLDDYKINITSDLDSILKNALEKVIHKETEKLENKLKNTIMAMVDDHLNQTNNSLGDFGIIKDELNNRLNLGDKLL